MFEDKKLNYMLDIPDGYICTDAILFTYSMNLSILNNMLIQCGIASTYNMDKESLKKLPDHVTCVMKNDRAIKEDASDNDQLYSQLLLNKDNCRVIGVNGKTFHPKLYAFLYKKDKENESEEKILRLIISSKNITSSSYYEGAICIEGKPGESKVDANEKLIKLMNDFDGGSCYKSFVDLISKTDFSNSIHEIVCDDNSTYSFEVPKIELPFALYERARVISPFLGTYNYLDKALSRVLDWRIITRKEIDSSKLPQDDEKKKEFIKKVNYINIYKDENVDSLIKLHAKIYAFSNGKNEKLPSLLYIGSSNFSENGLEKNNELMIKIESSNVDFVDKLDEILSGKLGSCVESQESLDEEIVSCTFEPNNEPSENIIKKILKQTEVDELGNLGRYLFDSSFDGKIFIEEFVSKCVNFDTNEMDEVLSRARNYKNKKHNSIIDRYLDEIIGR